MICPGCRKNLPLTLSVCPSCGTMIGDSIREGLASKIVQLPKAEKNIKNSDTDSSRSIKVEPQSERISKTTMVNEPGSLTPKSDKETFSRKIKTSEVNAKSTDPTLVEFQSKTVVVPEWRLHLRNVVRRRFEQNRPGSQSQNPSLKASGEVFSKKDKSEDEKNTVLERALRRIEESRSRFAYISESKSDQTSESRFRYLLGEKSGVSGSNADVFKTKVEDRPFKKAEIKTFPIIEKREEPKKFETTKLPRVSEIIGDQSLRDRSEETICFAEDEPIGTSSSEASVGKNQFLCNDKFSEDLIEDYAPLSQRFGAGLFDFILCVFLSFALLLPFIILGKGFFSVETLFAFLTTIAIVMFIYLTTSIAFFGKTVGMKIFSLEIVDVEENDYPTLHQAAINTVAYLLSIMTCGLGFLPALFNQERRAMHDLIAGTIVVKELK